MPHATSSLHATGRRPGWRRDEPSVGFAEPQVWLISSEQFSLVSRAMADLPAEQREVVTRTCMAICHSVRSLRAEDSIKTVQSRYATAWTSQNAFER